MEHQQQIEIDANCQFIADLETKDNLKRNYNLGLWNLTTSIRDLRLFTKGIKPHRNWKLRPLNSYFGLTGNKEVLLDKLTKINDIIKQG